MKVSTPVVFFTTLTAVSALPHFRRLYDLTARDEPPYDLAARDEPSYDLAARDEPFYDLATRDELSYDLAVRDEPVYDFTTREEPSYELATRDGELDAVVSLIETVVDEAVKLFTQLSEAEKEDKIQRGHFTTDLVHKLRQAKPQFNFIICHVQHRIAFKGKQGVDWYHRHREFPRPVPGTIGYEIYGVKSGEFWREGDGGYLNWALEGNFKGDGDQGRHVTFFPPK